MGTRKFFSILVFSAGFVVLASAESRAASACFSVEGDVADVADAWADVSEECSCASARTAKWRVERSSYLRCVRAFASNAVDLGTLRKPCKKELLRAARESVCGRPADAVTCCMTGTSGTSCEIVAEESDCSHHGGRYAELGTTDTCMDACADIEGPVCLTHSDCDDGNPCTWDTCDFINGCWNVNNGSCGPQATPTPGGGGGGGGGTSCSGDGTQTHGFSAKEQQFIDLLNDYRKKKGKRAVSVCTSLNEAAQNHSNDMRNKRYFGHDSKNGDQFWERACDAGYRPGCGPTTYMGEILAAGQGDAQATLSQFQRSAPHDAIMRDDRFTVVGLGHACGGYYGNYWSLTFAARDDASCR